MMRKERKQAGRNGSPRSSMYAAGIPAKTGAKRRKHCIPYSRASNRS